MSGGPFDMGEELTDEQLLALANLDDDLAGEGFDAILEVLSSFRAQCVESLELFRAAGLADEAVAQLEKSIVDTDAAIESMMHLRTEHPEIEELYEAERQRERGES